MAIAAPAMMMAKTETSHSAMPMFILAMFLIIVLIGSPFVYASAENERYLLPVLRAADPLLFANDSVVDALMRFRSAFYELLALAMRMTGASPDSIPSVLLAIYIVVRVAFAWGVFLLVRSLTNSTLALGLAVALFCQTKAAPLGGIALFGARLTHSDVAMVLCIFALACYFRNSFEKFWILLSAAIFVHPIITLHLAIVMLPILYVSCPRRSLRDLAGPCLFGISCVGYLLWMAPPPMSGREPEIFLAAKGSMVHVSLWTQATSGWITAVTVLTVTVLGSRRLLAEDRRVRLLGSAILWGAMTALLLSGVAVLTSSYRLAQIQPMRIFFWVWLLTLILVAIVTIEALRSRPGLGILLVAVCVFLTLESVWTLIFAFVGAALLVVEPWTARRFGWKAWDRVLRFAAMACLGGALGVWLIAGHLPFASFRDPALLAPCVLLVSALILHRARFETPMVVAAVALALAPACVHRWNYEAAHEDKDWTAVRTWCANNTVRSARFIVPTDTEGFRLIARRTAIDEPMSALAWVAPAEYVVNQRAVEAVREVCPAANCNVPALIKLARSEHVDFVIVRSSSPALEPHPLARFGEYAVLKTAEANSGNPL